MKKIIIGFPESKGLARNVAKKAGVEFSELELKQFPDKESYIQFNADLKGKKVFLFRSLDDPDAKITQVILAAYTAKDLGAKKVVLVAPYLCYMRQDKRFRDGEAVSSRIIAKLFNRCFDGLVTVDPHLHRFKSLDVIYKMKTKKITAVLPIADFIKKNFRNPFVFGPDEESYQWARSVAKLVGCESDVLRKHRYGPETVRIKVKERQDIKNKDIIIVDDVISTGHTMMEVIKDLRKMGIRKITCICTHGIFADNALKKIRRLGAKAFSTNTIHNEVSRIDISELLTKEIK
ncbi:ribose-phosphate diphosphokinase [Candidatus Woesearchaeota archaeon]|nr:ribose-phosphate diphosphokinase [Candidatus Woesearchaeota archaeon]